MGVWRKWVFPIIRIVLVAAVAAALVKLAFFPDSGPAEATIVPGGTLEEPQIPVQRGSISNDVELTGTVNADPAVPVKATGAGAVDEVFVPQGQPVAAGQKIFDIKVIDEAEPVEQPGPDGQPIVSVPEPTYHYEPVLAPAAGILSSLDVIPGQTVAVGEVSGQVAPPSFNVTATLSPEDQYRLTSQPTEATVSITGGPAPFTCTGLTITTPLSGAGSGGEGAQGPDASGGTTARCAVPAEVTVFSGLAAEVTIAAGRVDDVLVVPTTAVKGGSGTGVVWLVGPDGEGVETTVSLGLSDGSSVEVVDGLAEGDLVLQFVPGAMASDDGCTTNPDGSTFCEAPVGR